MLQKQDRKSATLFTKDSLWIGSLGRSAILTACTSLSGSKLLGSEAHSGGFGSLQQDGDLWWGVTLGWRGAMKDLDGLPPKAWPERLPCVVRVPWHCWWRVMVLGPDGGDCESRTEDCDGEGENGEGCAKFLFQES